MRTRAAARRPVAGSTRCVTCSPVRIAVRSDPDAARYRPILDAEQRRDSANRTCDRSCQSAGRPPTWLGSAASTRRSDVSCPPTHGRAPERRQRGSHLRRGRKSITAGIERHRAHERSASAPSRPAGGSREAGTSGSGRPFLMAIDRCTAVGGGASPSPGDTARRPARTDRCGRRCRVRRSKLGAARTREAAQAVVPRHRFPVGLEASLWRGRNPAARPRRPASA